MGYPICVWDKYAYGLQQSFTFQPVPALLKLCPPNQGGSIMEKEGQNELRQYIVLFGKMRPKKIGHSHLTIAAHLTNYTFIAHKVHINNPYIAYYTLL